MFKRFELPSSKVITASLIFLLLPSLMLVTKNTVARAIRKEIKDLKVFVTETARMNPIYIKDIKAKDKNSNIKNLKFGEDFEGGEDWLKSLTFSIANLNSKPIVYIQLFITFPETAATNGRVVGYPITFGQKPDSKFPSKSDPIHLKQGDKLEVAVDKYYDQIEKFLGTKQLSIKTLRKAKVQTGLIVFEDKTGYMAGMLYRQDPNNPDRYVTTGSAMSPPANRR